MSLAQRAHAIRARLMNPPNAVEDLPIDLKRKVIPIKQLDTEQAVPVNSWDVFGPKIKSIEDIAFGPIVHGREIPPPPVSDIIRFICQRYGFTKTELLSQRRGAAIVRARHIGMYMAKKLTRRSFPDIARRFGKSDHTTAIHAYYKIERLRSEDPDLNEEVSKVERLFVASIQREDATCSSAQTAAQ